MTTVYAYNGYVRTFSNGTTTFDATDTGVHQKGGNADGPKVVAHIAENDAGALVDLDGTGAATLVPGQVKINFIFTAANPNGHTQYQNLVKLKGAHGTLTMGVGRTGDVLVYSAPARLIEVTSNWEGANRYGVQSWLPVSAIWQLKDHLSN
ncbi:MAG: hypothetical protein K1X50_20795 [Candidatus Promineofilum sp.]|jgi:hypothetical protein|nr:hypothetical protein [Promineifilum sp.]